MCILIWVFPGRTCHFVDFVVNSWIAHWFLVIFTYQNSTWNISSDWYNLSHVIRKPVYAICEQQRLKSACASLQSDQRLCCLLPSLYNSSSFCIQNFKPLHSFCGCAEQFTLVANLEDRFSCDEAFLVTLFILCIWSPESVLFQLRVFTRINLVLWQMVFHGQSKPRFERKNTFNYLVRLTWALSMTTSHACIGCTSFSDGW